MTNVADVFLWGTRVGTVSFDEGAPAASFEYDRDFLSSGIQVSPLAMPLSGRVYSFPGLPEEAFHGLPGLLADSLPDRFGNAVIDAWLSTQNRQVSSLNPVERLCYTGSRGMGALEFLPSLGPGAGEVEQLELDRLVDLASEVLAKRKNLSFDEHDHAMQQIISVGTSAGGARAKAVIAWNENEGIIKSGQVDAGSGYSHWLLKFDGVDGNRDHEGADGPQYTRIEYAYHLMALDAGIAMSECRLYSEGDRKHFLTRRFDRSAQAGEKIHMQTLGALVHADLNSPGSYSYEQAARVLLELGLGQDDVEQLFARMVFNVVARNQDDHVKNISFLMDKKGDWSLAPAYDVTFAYNPGGLWTGSHQMTINGKREGIGREDVLACAAMMNITRSRASAIIESVGEASRCWMNYAEKAELSEDRAAGIARQFVEL